MPLPCAFPGASSSARIRHLLVTSAACLAALAAFAAAPSAHAAGVVSSARIASGLSSPVYATAPRGDDRLFIVERAGRIVVRAADGTLLATPFLDIRSLVGSGGERGLLGLAFAPDYASSGHFYVYYVDLAGHSVLARHRRSENPDVASPTARILLTVAQPPAYSNHKGGTIAFGGDGMLYWGLGDGGGTNDPLNHAQNDGTLLGKMLRLDVRGAFDAPYAVPPDNPFVGATRDPQGAIPDEIWAKGLRNPFRFAFDRWTGDLWIADVGQSQREEVDFEPASSAGGRNYGWRVMEGTRCNVADPPPAPACFSPELTLPIVEYDHALGCSITGGTVYRGPVQALHGLYLYGDFCSARLWTFDPASDTVVERTADLAPHDGTSIDSIVAIAEDGGGELVIVDLGGEVFRVMLEPVACGLGAEPALALPALLALRRRRRSARFDGREGA